MTAPQAPAAPRPVAQQSKLPAGVRMSTVWRRPDGQLVESATGVELPVDKDWRPTGALWLCQQDRCPTQVWVFDPIPTARPEQEYCTRHPLQLVPAELDPADPDPVGAARSRKTSRLADLYAARQQKLVDGLNGKADELRAAAVAAGRRTWRDLQGHLPSAAISTSGLLAGMLLVSEGGRLAAAAAGATLASAGTVAAYLVVYAIEKRAALADGDAVLGRPARKLRAKARHAAAGMLAAGAWLLAASVTGVNPGSWAGCGTLLAGAALVWAVNRKHWDKLWTDRRRLAELARLKAEETARRTAEEAARLAAQQTPGAPEVAWDDVLQVGQHYAHLWQQIARSDMVPPAFAMRRTWIVPEKTRALTAPDGDGGVRRIGHEFVIRCEPGALAARFGSTSPLVDARKWLADMLERDPATVELVDRPDGQPNTGLLILTDGVALGGIVAWKARAGIRIDPDGSRWAHRGRSLTGEDVYEATYIPGQNVGGLVIGRRGGGKSADLTRRLLNWLITGVFPIAFDPKQFVDLADFAGVFPMGCTLEHRDVILASLSEERKRRERWMTQRPRLDRHGRRRPGESKWDTDDGPPINHAWDEFHDLAQDDAWVDRFTNHIRFERAAAESGFLYSQGGGLADFSNSVLRSLLNQIELTTYRIDEHQARLGGARDMAYSPADLPQVPGMCLVIAPEVPPVPLRAAYIHRDIDRDGSVFDQLFGPNMEPLLTAPPLPPETVEVFERTGLMDLWRLGQGEGGLERLQSDIATPDGPMPILVQTTAGGQKLKAPDVILGIVMSRAEQVCERRHVDPGSTDDGSAVMDKWVAAGWSKAPDPSTISRAARQLEKDGLLSRVDDQWRVLPAGEARAVQALQVMLLVSGAQAAGVAS